MGDIPPEPKSLFDRVKDLILEDDLVVGDLLPSEAMLIERFGCSRASIREALKQLQMLGLVEIRRGIGTYVGPFTVSTLLDSIAFGAVVKSRTNPNTFLELLETRIALDHGMAPAICRAFTDQDTPELDSLVDEMEQAAAAGENFLGPDKEFHYHMQSAVGNEFALDLVSNFWSVFVDIGLNSLFRSQTSLADVAQAHRELLDAAKSGDVARYQDAVTWHYENSRNQAERFREESLRRLDGHAN